MGRYEVIVYITVDCSRIFGLHQCEDVVCEVLKGCQGVAKAEKHDIRVVKTNGGLESSFPVVFFFDSDIVIPGLNVKFGKELFIG
jgi:hypothetical protein